MSDPDIVRNVDDQVRQRDGWDRLVSLSARGTREEEEKGVTIRPIAVAKYVTDS